jgi:HD-like signal output (HDOD) protein
VANGEKNYSQLSICGRQGVPSASVPPGPEAVGLLRTLLSDRTPNLQAITAAIESDVGLVVRLFQTAAQFPGTVPPGVFDISEIVVHLGIKNLRAMISRSLRLRARRASSL